ncbi:MAG: hypothetical protein AABX85_02920 [Nanoarchaeota archaeon]
MAKTITSTVISVVKINSPRFVSQGELYADATRLGYNGSQERLIKTAERLADKGILDSLERGRAMLREYRVLSEKGN